MTHTVQCIGCISGTSVDGLDIALARFTDGPASSGSAIEIRAADTVALPSALRDRLLQLGQPGHDDLDTLGQLDAQLGEFIGTAIAEFLRHRNIPADRIDAIGSHGQTVRHRPNAQPHWTLQIGDPSRIAERTGIATIADFRRADIAAGGQGAPLVPPFHAALLSGEANLEHNAVLNIGGIANLTTFTAEQPALGFDTGPGNGLMDAWIGQQQQQPFDRDGAFAASGSVNDALLQQLLLDDYFEAPPPKSTGREYFNLAWLKPYLEPALEPAIVQATLAELTARSVSRDLQRHAPRVSRLAVCGGGRHNGYLMQRLQQNLPGLAVEPIEALGIDGDSLEAAAFAWLAMRHLSGEPGNAPDVTGARGPRVLGALWPGE